MFFKSRLGDVSVRKYPDLPSKTETDTISLIILYDETQHKPRNPEITACGDVATKTHSGNIGQAEGSLNIHLSCFLFLVYSSPCPLEVHPPDPQWTRKDNLRLRLVWRPPLSSSQLMRKYLESSVSRSRGIFFPSNPAASLNYSAGTVTQRRDKAAG